MQMACSFGPHLEQCCLPAAVRLRHGSSCECHRSLIGAAPTLQQQPLLNLLHHTVTPHGNQHAPSEVEPA